MRRGLSASAARRPPGLLAVLTGTRLADWRAIAGAWSDEDRAAFSTFVEERMRPAMLAQMASVRARQQALLRTPTLAGAFACMWRDGIHPLQDESAD